ncbi:MAG: LytTR family DNA-binding domain-containing protein [Cytophagales bacterium]|nr:LytTR family DNA-binding domain-containing protein [Cytophagales bacterium]
MNVIIIDDNPSMRDNLKSLLKIYATDLVVIGEGGGVKEGLALLSETRPDLLFLDVEMQDGTGFDLLAQLLEKPPTIFVTAHDAYAIKAFKFSALDYVLKPIDPDDLIKSIGKARERLDQDIKIGAYTHNAASNEKKLVLTDAQNTYLIKVSEIVRCESDVNYTQFILADGRSILVSRTLKYYHEILEEFHFFRCHQSHLVNLDHFDRYEKSEGGSILMKNGSRVPVSLRRKDELIALLRNL